MSGCTHISKQLFSRQFSSKFGIIVFFHYSQGFKVQISQCVVSWWLYPVESSTKPCDIPGRSWNVHDPVIRHINNYSCRRFISSHSSLRTSSKKSMWTSRIDRCERWTLSRNFHQLWYSSLHSQDHIKSGYVRKPITELRIFSVSAIFFLTVMISGRPGY